MNQRENLEAKLLPFLAAVLDGSVKDAAAFRFDKKRPQHLTAVCTYCTIIELAQGGVAVLEKGQPTALPVLLRSLFEAYADLCALVDDPQYHKNMYATFMSEKVRFLKNVLRFPSNPFFQGVYSGMDVKGELAELEIELAQLEKAGRPPLNHAARFGSGKLANEYQSIYWLLCLEGHNNMSALDDRHIEKNGEDFSVVLFKEPDASHIVLLVDSLVAAVVDSGRRIHKLLNTGLEGHYDAHRQALDRLRSGYVKD